MSPILNNATGALDDQAGITIAPIDYGEVTGISFIDPWNNIEPYFNDLIATLTKHGYVVGRSIRAAPYDWRLSPFDLEHRGYFNRTRRLVETMFAANHGCRVHLITHSLGGPVVLELIHQMGRTWSDKYIAGLTTVAAPWAGSVSILLSLVSGDNFGIMFLPHTYFRPLQVLLSTGAFLIPVGGTHFWGPTPMVVSKNRNYTANDMDDLMADLGLDTQREFLRRNERTLRELKPPFVHTNVIYGTKILTPISYRYDSQRLKPGITIGPPDQIIGDDGDGSVSVKSSTRALSHWADAHQREGFDLAHHKFEAIKHEQLIRHPAVINRVLQILGVELSPSKQMCKDAHFTNIAVR